MDTLQKLRLGYASLIGAAPDAFDTPGFVLEACEARAKVAWEDWLQPIWLVTLGETTVCAAAPQYAQMVKDVFQLGRYGSLLDARLLETLQQCFGQYGWQPLEILGYPVPTISMAASNHEVVQLGQDHPGFQNYSRAFSGGTYVILDKYRRIISWAGIKDHGWINEIAVGTEADYRKQGMGKAVVGQAVADILARGRVPVYVPNHLHNAASYGLACSLGFVKMGEMMLWEIKDTAK